MKENMFHPSDLLLHMVRVMCFQCEESYHHVKCAGQAKGRGGDSG